MDYLKFILNEKYYFYGIYIAIIIRNIKVMYAHYNSFVFQLTVNSKEVSNEKIINCDILLLIIE